MGNNRFGDPEINEGIKEYIEHKNPIIDKEYGFKIGGPTLFDLYDSLKGDEEDFDNNTPLDEEGNLCVEWFFDFKTGELKKGAFKIKATYLVGNKTYHVIRIPSSNNTFVIDLENRQSFPGLEKGVGKRILRIDTFGRKEIIALKQGMDDVSCIDENGKQIGETCLGIEKIKYGNIDILEFHSRVNPDYSVNDMRQKLSYLGSDGKQYKANFNTVEEGVIASFEVISDQLKEPIIIKTGE